MTTGSYANDLRVLTPFVQGGEGLVGLYDSRNWAGDDNIITDRTSENTYNTVRFAMYDPLVTYHDHLFPDTPKQNIYTNLSSITWLQDWTSNDDLSLYSRLQEKVRGHEFNALVSSGEARQSLEMIGHSARTLFDGLRALRRGDFNRLRQCFTKGRVRGTSRRYTDRELQDVWLEYEFGWRPLINDVYEASSAFYALSNRPLSKTYKARFRVYGSAMVGTKVIPSKCFISKEVRLTLKEDYSVSDSLGLTSPAEVAWELLPYSFVADWVIPVGTYLKVRNFMNNVSAARFTVSELKFRQLSTLEIGNFVVESSDPFYYKRVEVNRATAPLAVPRPSIKSLDRIVSFRKAVDAVSLLINFGRR